MTAAERSAMIATMLRERAERHEREIARGWRVPIYRDYHITIGPGYTPDSRWEFVHDDYDGPADGRYGFEATPEACRERIDEIEEDHAERYARKAVAA